MLRLLRKILTYGLGIAVVAVAAVVAVYAAGVKLPVRADTLPLVFPNWNKTSTVEADVAYDSQIWRADGRTHLTVKLEMPEAVQRLQRFLDGGRTEVVVCGPQRLFVHSLIDGVVGIDGDLVTIDGMMDMELAGLVNARDDMELSTAIRIGHDRTSITATVVALTLGQLPQPMIQAVLEQKSSYTYTREQVFDQIAKDMSPEDAAFLNKHRDALDPAIESVVPASEGNTFHLDAVISVNEGAVMDAAIDRLVEAQAVTTLARMLGPNQAHADLLNSLTRELEKAGQQLQGELEGNTQLRNLLADPEAGLKSLVDSVGDCKVTF